MAGHAISREGCQPLQQIAASTGLDGVGHLIEARVYFCVELDKMCWEFPGELWFDSRGFGRYPSSVLDNLEVGECQPLQVAAERPQPGSHLMPHDLPLDRREEHRLLPLRSLLCFHRRGVDPGRP